MCGAWRYEKIKEPSFKAEVFTDVSEMCFALAILTTIFLGAYPLVLKEIAVPALVALGSSATLNCKVETEGSQLSYLKWYKDELELCRFVPNSQPQIQIFSIPGLKYKDLICENTTLKLEQVPVAASGMYKCEASNHYEQKVMSSRNMSVMVYPTSDPVISGVMPDYREGEYIQANCTASPSNPPPKLNWFINGILADRYMIHEYTEAVDPGGLYRRALAIKLLAKEDIFSGPGGSLFLVCMVTLPGLPPWRATANSKIVHPPVISLPGLIENSTDFPANVSAYNSTDSDIAPHQVLTTRTATE